MIFHRLLLCIVLSSFTNSCAHYIAVREIGFVSNGTFLPSLVDLGQLGHKDDSLVDMGQLGHRDDSLVDMGQLGHKDDILVDMGQLGHRDDMVTTEAKSYFFPFCEGQQTKLGQFTQLSSLVAVWILITSKLPENVTLRRQL